MAISTKDNELDDYAKNFAARTTADPEDFAMLASEAAAFSAKQVAYSASLAAVKASRESGNRSQSLTTEKNLKKAELLQLARELYTRIQSSLTVTDANKDLVHVLVKKTEPTPIPAWPVAPEIKVESVYGNEMRLSIKDASGLRKGRPETVAGCTLFMFLGENPPTPSQTWQALGNVTKNQIIVNLPNGTPPNTRVHFCGFWYTQRGLSSPTSTPISAYTTHGGATPLEA